MTLKKKLGLQKLSNGNYAVVDYNRKLKSYSKVLTMKEEKVLKLEGKLPHGGVTEIIQFDPVAVFETEREARQFLKTGADKRAAQTGIFRSVAQGTKAKKLVKQ